MCRESEERCKHRCMDAVGGRKCEAVESVVVVGVGCSEFIVRKLKGYLGSCEKFITFCTCPRPSHFHILARTPITQVLSVYSMRYLSVVSHQPPV
jgi:hypothetical protein